MNAWANFLFLKLLLCRRKHQLDTVQLVHLRSTRISKRQTMRQSLKSTPPIIGDVASCIRPEDYLTMA